MSARVQLIRVPSQIPSACKIAFVAEAPGDEEELYGTPLIGPAGKVFNKLLANTGIVRADCYVGNVLDFKLPENKIKNICSKRYKTDGPWADWCMQSADSGAYLPEDIVTEQLSRLRLELNACGAEIVIGMGGLAVWALLGLKAHGTISKVRGTIHAGKLTDQRVLCTYHPAYLLPHRNPGMIPVVMSDLHKARREVEGHTQQGSFGKFTPVERASQVAELLARLSPPVAVDIETVRRCAIDCIGFSDGELTFSVPIFDNKTFKPYWSFEDEVVVRSAICKWLGSPIEKIWQNGSGYDIQVLWELWRVIARGYVHDTRILHRSLWSEMKANLGSMVATHLDLPTWKPIKGSEEKSEV